MGCPGWLASRWGISLLVRYQVWTSSIKATNGKLAACGLHSQTCFPWSLRYFANIWALILNIEVGSLRLLFLLKDPVIGPCGAPPPEWKQFSLVVCGCTCYLRQEADDAAVTVTSSLVPLLWTLYSLT